MIQSKPWEESSGELRVEWVRKVEAFINAYRPTYLSLFRKEPPNMPVVFSGDADRIRVLNSMRIRVDNLATIMYQLRQLGSMRA